MKWKLVETLNDEMQYSRVIIPHLEFNSPYDAFDSLRTMFFQLREAGMFVSIGGTGAEPNATIYMPKGSVIWTLKECN